MSTPVATAASDAAIGIAPVSQGDQISAYRWAIAWVVLIVILMFVSRLRVGYTILYYLATLTLLFILLTQYQGIAWVLNPFVQQQQQGGSGNG